MLLGASYLGSLFDLTHVLYMIVSLSVSALLIYFGKRVCKTPKQKDQFLFVFAFLTFALHISVLWVDFLKNGQAGVPDNVLFPIYFCNLSMYVLFFVSLAKNQNTKVFRFFAIMAAYGGIFGSLISLFYPQYYLGAASIFEWGVFKSMLSHSTMLIGGVWLLVNSYFVVEMKNVLIYFYGLLVYGLIGLAVNGLFDAFGLYDPNAMYLSHPPLAEAPFLNTYVIAFLMCLIIAIGIRIYQKIRAKQSRPLNQPLEATT